MAFLGKQPWTVRGHGGCHSETNANSEWLKGLLVVVALVLLLHRLDVLDGDAVAAVDVMVGPHVRLAHRRLAGRRRRLAAGKHSLDQRGPLLAHLLAHLQVLLAIKIL